jgi:Stress responsive A/B Barrel Domain
VRMLILCGVILVGSVVLLDFGSDSMAKDSAATAIEDSMLAHNVFFTLKDKSPEAKKKLVDACKKYLSKHPGTVFFAAGTLCEELDRPVNDRDFDVGLHVIFKTKADQDRYQDAPLHLQFIAENKDNWAKVRVFDSVVGQ